MSTEKENILAKLKALIEEGKSVSSSNEIEFKSWIKRSQAFVDRITSGVIKEEAMKIIQRHPSYFATSSSTDKDLHDQTTRHYAWQQKELVPVLEAIYEDIDFFEKNDTEKEASKMKKHFEIEGGIPGLLKGKWGAKDK